MILHGLTQSLTERESVLYRNDDLAARSALGWQGSVGSLISPPATSDMTHTKEEGGRGRVGEAEGGRD